MQPGLIGGMSHELQRATEDEYARQFLAAIRANLKVKMNAAAITELKHRLLTGGS